jgi:hypothetical protein
MIESEFRDWTRGQLRRLDERLKALAAERLVAPPPPKVGGKFAGGQVAMAEKLLARVKQGGVTSLAIVYVGDEGPIDGWSCSGGATEHFTLLGAMVALTDDLLHPEKDRVETFKEETDAGKPSGSPSADPATAQG